MGHCRVIFWDVYGTLVAAQRGDLDSLVRRKRELQPAFADTARQFGLTAPPETLHQQFLQSIVAGRRARADAGIEHPEIRIERVWQELLQQFGGPASDLETARSAARYFEARANPKRLQPGAAETLATLHERGLGQGIISNAQFYTPLELSELLAGDDDRPGRGYTMVFDPDLIFLSCDLGVAKPDLAAYRRAAATLAARGIGPSECVMVGDSVANDIGPAKQTGFRAVLFAPEAAVAPTSAGPDVVIRRLPQLLEWV